METAELLENFVKEGGRLAILEKIPCYSMKREEDEKLREINEAEVMEKNTGISHGWRIPVAKTWFHLSGC